MSWTDERVTVLKKLWAEGHSASQIAKQLGGVTRNAVIGKVHRLGLSGRATPSRPVKRPPRLARPKPRFVTEPVAAAAPAASPPLPGVTAAPAPPERGHALTALPPLPMADGAPATILTLRDSMCKWPIGDPADPKFAFCGRKADCGPYCAEHAAVAFQPARKREGRKTEYDYVRRIAG
ncbi:MAG: GcrA family cell cycle regulator [Hyphomonas sp.]